MFIPGDNIKRIRRFISPASLNKRRSFDNSTTSHLSAMNGTAKWSDYIPSHTPTPSLPAFFTFQPLKQWSTPSPNNDDIHITLNCESYTEETFTDGTTKDDITLVVLTYVGLYLSILAFVLVLMLTYSLFKVLRTVPSVNLMNLSLAHLLLDLLHLATGYV